LAASNRRLFYIPLKELRTNQLIQIQDYFRKYIVAGFLFSLLWSQSDFSFINISVEDGLSESTVKVIFEDHHGFIYIGTENGLDFYDGYEFKNYQMNAFDESSLLGNKISTIYEDSNHLIWVGSELGISQFDPTTRNFYRPVNLDKTEGLTLINPETIAEDANGNIWVKLFDNDQIFRIDQANDTTICMNCTPDDILFNQSIHSLFEDRTKTIWFGTITGLYQFNLAENKILRFDSGSDNSDIFQSSITAIEQGQGDVVWVGSQQGLGKISSDGVSTYTRQEGQNSIVSNVVNDLDWDSGKKELWIATQNGLSRYVPDKNTFYNIQETPYANSIIENDVNEILIAEKSGNLWFTTENHSGINCLTVTKNPYYDEMDTSFTHLEYDPIDPFSIADNNISTFIEDKAGHVWIGTQQNGLSFYSFVIPKFTSIQYDQENEWGLKSDKIFSIATLSDGYLWAGTSYGLELLSPGGIRDYDFDKFSLGIHQIMDLEIVNDEFLWVGTTEGVLKIDLNTDEFIRYGTDNTIAKNHQLPDDVIYDIYVGQNEKIWLGTRAGLSIIDFSNDSTINFSSELIPRVISEDAEGNLWIGTEMDGLYLLPVEMISNVLNGDEFEIEGHIFDEAFPEGMSSARITSITQDQAGIIWVGTANGGLNKYNKEEDVFSHYFVKDGLPSNYITAIAVDDENNLWISTKNGISFFNQSNQSFTNYDLSDGIGNIDFFRNSYSISEDGNFFFGGPKGITIVNPSKIQYNQYQPPCVITRIKTTSYDDVVTERFGGFSGNNLSKTKGNKIEIDHKIKSFTIDFVALNYHKTEKNQYRYKLENLDKDWVETDGLRFASYNNLGRGSYQFKVQGSNDDGVWSESEILAVHFIPHPLLSYWAFGIYFVLASIGIYVFIQYRMEKHKGEMEEERRIQEMDQAREFQESLIPQTPPEHPDYEFAFHMKTSTEVGGDYYDFFPQDDGSIYIVVGDATGHGMTAGMMVSITKAGLVSTNIDTPVRITEKLNKTIKSIDLGTTRMSLNMTKIENGTFEFTSAGMPPGYIYRDEDKSVEEILVPGLPLGSMKEAKFDKQKFNMKSGDAFVLISDGLPECANPNGDMLDYEAVKNCVHEKGNGSAQDIIDSLMDLGESWMSGRMNDDDITLVVIKKK